MTRPFSVTHAARDTALERVLVSSYCCSYYRVADPFRSWVVSLAPSLGAPLYYPIDDCEHTLLYLPGIGIASQERSMSGPCQQNLAGICNSVWVLFPIFNMVIWFSGLQLLELFGYYPSIRCRIGKGLFPICWLPFCPIGKGLTEAL
jgi:hypothetical protein